MFSIKYEDKKIKLALIAVILTFFIVDMIYIFRLGNSSLLGSLELFNNDDVKYIRSAWNLIENGILSYENINETTVYIMPGLTLILSSFIAIFGKLGAIVGFRVFQGLLQCLSLYLIFLIGRKVFNSRIALIGCIINSLYIVELYASSLILMEVIFKFLFLLLIYLSIYAIERKSTKLYILSGVVWSLACLFKPPIAVYPAVILFLWIRSKEYKLYDIIKYGSIVSIIFVVILSPWWIRNYKVYDRFIPFTLSSGNPFLQGTFINYDQSGGFGVEYRNGENSIENNQFEIDAGLERLKIYGKQNPIKYILWYTLGKTWYFWRAPFYWQSIVGFTIALIEHIFIIGLAIKGFILIKRRKMTNCGITLIGGIVLIMNLAYLPFYTFERYSYPLMGLVILFAAYGINNLIISKNKRIYK